MKKFLALALSLLCLTLLAVGISAAAVMDEQRSIPYAAVVPTIDGVKADGEWDNALVCKLGADNCDAVSGTLDTCPDATFYWMWTYDGLYFFGDVTDNTENGAVHSPGEGSYNSGDGIQFCIYPDVEMSGSNWGDLYFWSLVMCGDGTAAIGEHFVYGTGSAGADAEDATVAGVQNGTSYTLEAFMPCSCWTESNVPLAIEDGTTFAMTNVIMEHDGAAQSLIIDSAWFDGPNSNKYTLTGGDPTKKVVYTDEEPTFEKEIFWYTGDADSASSYDAKGGLEVDLFNFASGGSAYCVKRDTYVAYDFEAPSDGCYTFVLGYIARTGAQRGVDYSLDDPDGTKRVFLDLEESDVQNYAVGTFETTKGPHTFYVYAPSGMDDSTLKSCDMYTIALYETGSDAAAALMKPILEEKAAREAEEAAKAAEEAAAKAAEEAAKKAEEEAAAKAAEEAAKAAEEAAAAASEAVEEAAEAVGDAVAEAADTAAEAVEEAKSGCGSMIGGGLIVLVTVLGSAWISRRKD